MAGIRLCVHHPSRLAATPGLPHPALPPPRGRLRAAQVRLHNLRYGAASLAHSAGAGLKTVQEQLGHTSIVPTADTYTASCSSTTVIVRMPAYFAEHLAPVLASWTTIGELVSKLSYD